MNASVQAAGLQLHSYGANVNAIAAGAKQPINKWKGLCDRRQTEQEVTGLPWHKAAGVGVINGPGGWRTFDLDQCPAVDLVAQLLVALNLPPDYRWVWRSGSGTGWEIAFLCHDVIPAGVLSAKEDEPGVFWGLPKDGNAFDHIELRWEHCQTIYPPSAYCDPNGPGYQWRGEPPAGPPATVSAGHVLNAFFTVAKLKRTEPKAQPTPRAQAQTTAVQPAAEREAIDEIKRRFDLLGYALKHWPGTTQQERNGEIRILGYGGFLINEEKGVWDRFAWDAAGGDCIELVGRRLYEDQWDNTDGRMFRAALEEAARETGVELPTFSKAVTNGEHAGSLSDVTPLQIDDEVVTLKRVDYERLRARAAAADRSEAWRQWAEAIVSREGLRPSEKGVMVGMFPIIDATRHLAGNADRVPLNYEHVAEVLKTSKSTVGRAVEIGEQVGLWRRDPEIAQTKEGYDIQHMRLELQPAFDDPRQTIIVDRPKQGGARPGSGRKPKCAGCPPGTVHRMVTARTVSYYCKTHGLIGEETLPDLVEDYVPAGVFQDETEEGAVVPSVANLLDAAGENQDETGECAEAARAADAPVPSREGSTDNTQDRQSARPPTAITAVTAPTTDPADYRKRPAAGPAPPAIPVAAPWRGRQRNLSEPGTVRRGGGP